jgi:hypothetical protein
VPPSAALSRATPIATIKWMKKHAPRAQREHVHIKTSLIEKQRDYLKSMFAIFDKDGGGSIDLLELKDALMDFGFNADEADDYLDVFAKLPSVQDDGEIDLEEFVHAMATSSTLSEPGMFYFHQDEVKCGKDQGAIKFAEFASNYERLIAQRKIEAGAGENGYAHFQQLFSGSYNVSRPRIATKDMSKAAVDRMLATAVLEQRKVDKELDAKLELEELQIEERNRRLERRRRRRRKRQSRSRAATPGGEGNRNNNTTSTSTNSSSTSRQPTPSTTPSNPNSRPGTSQSSSSRRSSSSRPPSRSAGGTESSAVLADRSELSSRERRQRIRKVLWEHGEAAFRRPRKQKQEALRGRKRDALRRAQARLRGQRKRNAGRMRKHESTRNAKLHLRATRVVRESASLGHSNSLPQIMATANMLTRAKYGREAAASAADFRHGGGSGSAGNLAWIPPTITSGIHRRAAAVIGLRSVHAAGGVSSPFRSPSRGSLVRSRGGEARGQGGSSRQYLPGEKKRSAGDMLRSALSLPEL